MRTSAGWAVAMGAAMLLAACGDDEAPGVDAGRDAGPVELDAGPSDGGAGDAGEQDASAPDAGEPDSGPEPTPPSNVFFVGNSFTFGGPVPTLVHDLAVYAGFPEPNVEFRAIGGQTLAGHRADTAGEGAPARIAEGWDVVVLQEYSTRPTDSVGPAEQFKEDATWFYDLAKSASPECEVILYQTWARRAGHSFYPRTFASPAQMQAELRFHYADAAERFIPMNSLADRPDDVRVAPAGDAWERQLEGGEPPRLHASDDYHASDAGAYLSALVLYSTIYGRRADGLVPLRGLGAATAQRLQDTADAVTGASGWGAAPARPRDVAVGATMRFDVGPLWVEGWAPLADASGTVGPVSTVAGEASSVLATTWGFSGPQEGGSAANTLDLPADVSRDSLWVGSFDGHAVAATMEARVVLRGLPRDGTYELELFASRSGDDGGNGRLTRYSVGGEVRDLDVVDNTSRTVRFAGVRPDARGEIVVRVGVSPEGSARFAYLGALWVRRT